MLWLYEVIRLLFKAASGVFYASFDVRGLEHVPLEGEPTLLCFNHGNSLGDPVVIISNTPRVVHFCAKNTLWAMPAVGTLVRMSGAIPVYRTREHGEKAKEFNVETFKAVYAALERGACVAFAPEGVSSFTSYSVKFKSGVAFIAVETVLRAKERGNTKFSVKLLPAIMAWTHREKFRSDVLLRYIPPLVVNYDFLLKYKSTPNKLEYQNGSSNGHLTGTENVQIDIKKAATAIITELEDLFHENILSAPSWKVIKLAITATRIHRPLGTYLSLNSYMFFLKGWLEILKSPTVSEKLMTELENYQTLIDSVKIKDERFRRVEVFGKRDSLSKTVRIVSYRLLICLVLFIICTPGLIIWSPAWFFIKQKERSLLKQGAGWADSIAEHKMLYAFFFLVCLIMFFNFFAPLLLLYLWLTMRLYEEAVACARSLFGLTRLYLLTDTKLNSVLEQRKRAKEQVWANVKLFPKRTAATLEKLSNDDVYAMQEESAFKLQNEKLINSWWHNFSLMRRRKKDWNELLRFSDYCTMDYVE